MGQVGKAIPENWVVRVAQEEMGRIFQLRDSLDQGEVLAQHAEHYQELGWQLAPVEAPGGENRQLDFTPPPEGWGERLMTLTLAGVRVDLGVKTGRPSGLLVLEVPRGEAALDRYGEWRSPCRAQDGNGCEQHYFALPPGGPLPTSGELPEIGSRVFAEGSLVMVPPSRLAGNGHAWSWVSPPWVSPPESPRQAVWKFLEDCGLLGLGEETDSTDELLPWDQVFQQIGSQERLLKMLLAPASSVEAYYQGLAQAAGRAGISDPQVILSLLWHAPQGDAHTTPERMAYLRKLAVAAGPENNFGDALPTPEPFPGNPPLKHAAPTSSPPQGAAGHTPVPQAQPPMHDIFGFLENRVILDRSRYEALVFELGELTAKAASLERRLGEWERRLGHMQPLPGATPEVKPLLRQGRRQESLGRQTAAPPLPQASPTVTGLKGVVQEFLVRNEDLAADPKAVQMLQFCLKNYIDINPEHGGLPFQEKLEMAGKMARDFLGGVWQGKARNRPEKLARQA